MSDIAINPVTRRVQFTGNTGTGPYAFTFNVLQSSDIVVYKNNVLLTETTDYTVSIAANGTGNITMVVALVLTDILTIIGGRELSRTTDFVTAGDLLASSLNEQLDSNVIMSQQLDERFGRTLNVPPGDEDKTLALPLAADRADKVLTFDTEGNVQAQTASDLFGGAVLGGNFVVNTGTGDGSTVAFGLTGSPGVKTNIQIYIDGVYQDKASFSLSAQTVTFTEAPPLNAGIEFIFGESVTTITGDASAITYDQGGTGAQDRTVKTKLQEFVSVKDFGAVGDGVTDDTAAIQAASDYAASISSGKVIAGGTLLNNTPVLFPSGEYYISSEINASSLVDYIGIGKCVVVGNAKTNNFLNFNPAYVNKIVGFEAGNFDTVFKFVTNNVDLAQITIENCSSIDNNCFVDSTGFSQSRSTSLVLRNIRSDDTPRVAISYCDMFIIEDSFIRSNKTGTIPFFIDSMATFKNVVCVPQAASTANAWIDFDYSASSGDSRGLNLLGNRFSGENGGWTIVDVNATGNDMSTSRDAVNITFVGGYADSSSGGIVRLMNDGGGNSHCPNSISFTNTAVNFPNGSGLVDTEGGLAPALNNEKFIISIDAGTQRSIITVGYQPTTDEVLGWNDGALMKDLQLVDASSVSTVNIGKSHNIRLTGTGTITSLSGQRSGDKVYMTFASGSSVTIQDASVSGNIHLQGNANFTGTANDVLGLIYDGNADLWMEIARSAN